MFSYSHKYWRFGVAGRVPYIHYSSRPLPARRLCSPNKFSNRCCSFVASKTNINANSWVVAVCGCVFFFGWGYQSHVFRLVSWLLNGAGKRKARGETTAVTLLFVERSGVFPILLRLKQATIIGRINWNSDANAVTLCTYVRRFRL